jgi:hypothetical protein
VFPSYCVQGYISLKVSSLLLIGYVYRILVTNDRYDDLAVRITEEGFNLIWKIQITFDHFLRRDFSCRFKFVTTAIKCGWGIQ